MIKNSLNQKRNKNNKKLINIKDFQILFMPNKINLNSIENKNNNLKSIESSKNNTNILNNSSIKKTLYTENDIIKQTLQSRNSNNNKTIFKRKNEIFNEFLADMRKIKKPPKFQLKYKSEQENEFIDYFHTNSPPKYKIERTNIVEYKINK